MRRFILLASALPIFLASPALAASALPGWLAGTWSMEQGAAWADEVWTTPRGDMMLGLARLGFGADVEVWQSTRIVRKPDGSLSYIAQTKGGAAVEYPAVVDSPYTIEFANSGHDFPQRIRFWREGRIFAHGWQRCGAAELPSGGDGPAKLSANEAGERTKKRRPAGRLVPIRQAVRPDEHQPSTCSASTVRPLAPTSAKPLAITISSGAPVWDL